MGNKEHIAIIIPAYKSDFLREAIESVLNQTYDCYRLYIFNDDSPDERVDTICRSFAGHPRVAYFRFEENLGGQSLPAHWNRCIRATGNEEWIWLFSDDDLMDDKCLRNFRSARESDPDIRLFRFNTVKFREDALLRRNDLPSRISWRDWLEVKLTYRAESYVVEYIFQRSLYEQIDGFADFPLGWCADDWFWIGAMQHTDLYTVSDALVYWRYSGSNISGSGNTHQTSVLKVQACCLLIDKILKMDTAPDEKTQHLLLGWAQKQLLYLQGHLSPAEIESFRKTLCDLLPGGCEESALPPPIFLKYIPQ